MIAEAHKLKPGEDNEYKDLINRVQIGNSWQ
jgi:hypothetical protein